MRRAWTLLFAAAVLSAIAACSSDTPAAPTTITVSPPGSTSATAPTITAQPANQTVTSGQTAVLTVAAGGTAPFAYQWYAGPSGTSSAPMAGATATTVTTPPLTAPATYWVRVSNAAGTTDSSTATITISPPAGTAPTIVTPPQNQSVVSGQSATLTVAAGGTAPLDYQWYVGPSGTTFAPIGGATSASATTPPLTSTVSVWVRVSNAYGNADSMAAIVTVTPDPSVLAFEDQVLTLVNQRRAAGATCGGTPYPAVGPLAMNANLRSAARGHSEDMAANNYFSHTSLDGRTFSQRIRNAGYTGSSPMGENIAAGYATPQSVVDGWMTSPGHCTNIMSGGYRALGVGYAYRAGSAYGHYWTQDFGGS